MTTIFVSHIREDAACAEQICKDLETRGYTVWQEPETLELNSILNPRSIENIILGSGAIIIIWSSNAIKSEWVERHILTAQSLKKLIFPVLIDETSLPNTLVSVSPIISRAPYTDIAAQLPQDFPSPHSTDPLIILSEQAAHNYIRVRKEAIDSAGEMLKRDEHREIVLALLEHLTHNDLMMGVRDRAQEVLDTDAKKDIPPLIHSDESPHSFGVRCKNGHVSYFDKRRVCSAYKEVPRDIRQSAEQELDELYLKCDVCGTDVVARIDCRDYK